MISLSDCVNDPFSAFHQSIIDLDFVHHLSDIRKFFGGGLRSGRVAVRKFFFEISNFELKKKFSLKWKFKFKKLQNFFFIFEITSGNKKNLKFRKKFFYDFSELQKKNFQKFSAKPNFSYPKKIENLKKKLEIGKIDLKKFQKF